MRHVVKVQRIGDEIGFVVPAELIERCGLKEGDELYPVKQHDGILLTRDKSFAETMGVYEVIAVKYRNALRALADS